MNTYYLAIDIGASSGRHILGHVEEGKIILQEVYRFENKLISKEQQLCWDIDRLFQEILNGMKRCNELGMIPLSMGIDTWAVDFVLLDQNDQVLGNAVAYRDKRTQKTPQEVYQHISAEKLYERTGIQMQNFNSIYQLYTIQKTTPYYMEQAKTMLMIPEYFNFLLTDVKMNEYTNATTTQLVNAKTNTWDRNIIQQLGFKKEIFGELFLPKTKVGNLKKEIQEFVGFDCQVILPATHDTASAVLAVPTNDEDSIYLSSGTWSLMGIERKEADCSIKSYKLNFTNEGGYDYRYRYLKNIMGLWIIQSIKKELNNEYSFQDLLNFAKKSKDFPSQINVNDQSFLAPENMVEAVRMFCEKTGQQVPQTLSEIMACVYHSLAKSYANTVKEIEEITQKTYSRIHIVGGGSQDEYLNHLTAKYSNKPVYTGPIEATAIGNLMVQMLRNKEFSGLEEARKVVAHSFSNPKYE
ncbi:MAG: rhamnulokinase [Epulopiscium sp.]|nr:rhamnulokinase [Candidatus Epulonipiscium sp.]